MDTELGEGMAFRLDRYEALLRELLDDGYRFRGYEPPESKTVVLRHDIDLSIASALEMARLEAEVGVTSTYCFLLTAPVYDLTAPKSVETLETIRSLGHDVGLHFDTHVYWETRPDRSSLVDAVDAERRVLARLVDAPVDVVSFHIPPEWVLDESFESFVSAYDPRYFSEIAYVSDSNQKWRRRRPFEESFPEAVQVLVHPGLWGPTDRPIEEIVETLSTRCHEAVDRYLDPIGG